MRAVQADPPSHDGAVAERAAVDGEVASVAAYLEAHCLQQINISRQMQASLEIMLQQVRVATNSLPISLPVAGHWLDTGWLRGMLAVASLCMPLALTRKAAPALAR